MKNAWWTRIPGIKTGKIFLRWLIARVSGGALILGYHRISSSQGVLDEACASPENFAEHLQELRKHTHPIRLSELVRHLRDGTLPDKSVALTFDDGYSDNLYLAKPLLEEYEIPATVFVCTGFLGREFWWDELQGLVLCSRADPRALRLNVGTARFAWDSPRANFQSGGASIQSQLCQALYHFMLSLDAEDQNYGMELIRSWSGVTSLGIPTSRAMNEDELLQLVDGGLIELGAHTRHHPMLPQLSLKRQEEEIRSSKMDLEAILGKKIEGFSYPNGRATVDTKRLVREMGFSYACTSLHDVVRPGNDVYELTRFWQQDVDGERFLRRLARWTNL
jgi:peptidoglycan/xylan/chitin deacetylase (PgdA/CDA1 family)